MTSVERDLGSVVETTILTTSGFGNAVVTVVEEKGTVKLIGRVVSEQDKRSLEEFVQRLEGVIQVINELEIVLETNQ